MIAGIPHREVPVFHALQFSESRFFVYA